MMSKRKLINRYRFGWRYHLLVCLLAGLALWIYWSGVIRDAYPSNRNDILVLAALGTAVFYLSFLFFWPFSIYRYRINAWLVSLIALLVMVAVIAFMVWLSMRFGNLAASDGGFRLSDLLSLLDKQVVSNFVPYLLPSLVSLVASFVAFVIEWGAEPFVKRNETEQAIAELQQACLRAHVDVHTLDNHLTTLYVIEEECKEKFQEAFFHTCSILHFRIGSGEPESHVRFGEELDCVESMVEIQRLRYGEALAWTVDADDDCRKLWVIVMTVMTVAENMTPHAVLNRRDKPASIRVSYADGRLEIVGENWKLKEKRRLAWRKRASIGMPNLKKRLDYYYRGRHELTIKEDEEKYRIRLVITDLQKP